MSRDSTASTGVKTAGLGRKSTNHLQLLRSLADSPEFWKHSVYERQSWRRKVLAASRKRSRIAVTVKAMRTSRASAGKKS